MIVRVRSATAGDLEAINDVYNPYVLTSTCTAEVTPVDLEQRARWFASRDLFRHPVTVACDETGDVVGWGALSPYHARWGYRFTCEDSVYVREELHGRGVGRALLDDLVARARAAGHASIVALVTADQAASVRLHERAGFARRGLLPRVIHKLERWVDLAILQRTLTDETHGA